MPERTSDGGWKWGNVKRKSRKKLAQTVYGIWKSNGSKGSFSKFYHEGNSYGYKHRKDQKKHMKESYQYNPLNHIFEGKEVDMILGTITDEREKAFLIAARKIAKDFTIIHDIYRDDNCIYVNLKDNYVDKKDEVEELRKALETLVKGFHFGKVDLTDKSDEFEHAFFSMISCPSDRHGVDLYRLVKESFQFKRPLFSKKPYTMDDIAELIKFVKLSKENPNVSKSYLKKLDEVYWKLRLLRVQMRRKAITEVPESLIIKISSSV